MNTVTRSSYVYSQRKNNTYHPGDVIEFYITPSNSFINTQNTHLVFNVKLTGNQYKGCLSSDAGVYSLFRNVTISTGDGETVLEELGYYAGAQAVKYHYESNESGNNLQYLHEGRPIKNYIDDTSYNQYCDCTANDGSHYKTVEITAPLWLSGILSPNRTLVWTNAYTKGLRIRIELYDANTLFEAAQAPMFNTDGTPSGNFGGYMKTAGYRCFSAAASGTNVLVLQKQGDTPSTEAVQSANVARKKHTKHYYRAYRQDTPFISTPEPKSSLSYHPKAWVTSSNVCLKCRRSAKQHSQFFFWPGWMKSFFGSSFFFFRGFFFGIIPASSSLVFHVLSDLLFGTIVFFGGCFICILWLHKKDSNVVACNMLTDLFVS